KISISIVVRRPGWESWALGKTRRETLTVKTPVAKVVNPWVTVGPDARANVRFDRPVDRVSVAGADVVGRRVRLPPKTPGGAVMVAAAGRKWETLGKPVRVTWFPQADHPVVLVSPGPNAHARPLAPIKLTFSEPVSQLLGDKTPTLVPSVDGHWAATDDHTLVFRPSGTGFPFNSEL